MNIYLRHPRHGTKVAISQQEARDEMETPASSVEEASGVSANALSVKRRRRSSATA